MDLPFRSLLTGKYPLTTTHHHHHHPSPATSDESSTTPPPQKQPYHHLKKPKLEHPQNNININPYHHPMIMFHQLPDLTSFENLPPLPSSYYYPPLQPSFPRKKTTTAREKTLQKRRTLSEKTRSLQKVLPFDKKMDMGTLLEETYKYIKFLQAQVKVLELMPVDSSTTGSNFGSTNEDDNVTVAAYGNHGYGYGCGYGGHGYGYGDVYGALRRLNRQQLLEVIVNSPAAQEVLYKRGCCVYSTEQLVVVNDLLQKNYNASMYY